jgi:hypothetical protein
MNPERILIAAEAVGLGQLALSRAGAYAKTRIVFNRPIEEPSDPTPAREKMDGIGSSLADDVVGGLPT